jgi:hypothetical protein
MTDLEDRFLGIVRNKLGTDRLNNAIVYLDRNLVQAGKKLHIGDVDIEVPWDAYIVFVDQEPRLNWGHDCSYLVVRQDADDVIQVAAQMPPFLKPETSTFRLLWRGPNAPQWAVATNEN